MMFTNFEGAFDSAPFREFCDVTSERCIDELTDKQMSTRLIIRIQKITSELSADLVDRIRCLISISRNPTDLVLLEQSVVFMRKNGPRGEKYTDLELKLYGFPIIDFFIEIVIPGPRKKVVAGSSLLSNPFHEAWLLLL